MERARETLHHAWENIRNAAHERRRGSNFTFHSGILLILITSGTVIGLLLGVILSLTNWKPTSRDLHYLGYLGKLFIGALRSMNIPLVLASVISAAGSMEFRLCVKTVILGLGMFVGSVHASAWLGISIALLVRPGNVSRKDIQRYVRGTSALKAAVVADLFLDLFRSFFPRNIVEAALKTYQTQLELPKNVTTAAWEDYKIVPTYKDGTNFNGLIVYGVVMGLAAVKLGVYGKPLIAFTRCLSECVAFLSNCIMWAAPVGIASLLATDISRQPNVKTAFTTFYRYVLSVVLCALIWEVIMLALVKVITRRSIRKFLKDLLPALVTAFGTSSSLSTAPVLLTCLDINGINPRVSRFLTPLACVSSLVGSTIFTISAVMAILQYLQEDFGFTAFIQMSLLAPPAAISIAGGQGSFGYVVKLLLIVIVGKDNRGVFEEISDVVQPVDWFIDRVGTVCNVVTMASLVTIACHIRRKELEELPDYNAILKEGLVFKRLSLLKTSVTSGHSEKPLEEVSQLKEQLHIAEPDPADLTPEQRKKRNTLRRLTAILTEPFLRQQQNNASTTDIGQAVAEKSDSKVKKTKKPKLKLTNIKKAVAKPLGVGKKKKEQ